MLSLLIFGSFSAISCPKNMPFHYDDSFSIELANESFYYFYSSQLRHDEPVKMDIYSTKRVLIYTSSDSTCPSTRNKYLLRTRARKHTFVKLVDKRSPNTFIVGIYSKEPAKIQIRMLGQNPSPLRISIAPIISLLFIMVTAVMFLYVISNRVDRNRSKR